MEAVTKTIAPAYSSSQSKKRIIDRAAQYQNFQWTKGKKLGYNIIKSCCVRSIVHKYVSDI